jgi:hypothetical protein
MVDDNPSAIRDSVTFRCFRTGGSSGTSQCVDISCGLVATYVATRVLLRRWLRGVVGDGGFGLGPEVPLLLDVLGYFAEES